MIYTDALAAQSRLHLPAAQSPDETGTPACLQSAVGDKKECRLLVKPQSLWPDHKKMSSDSLIPINDMIDGHL